MWRCDARLGQGKWSDLEWIISRWNLLFSGIATPKIWASWTAPRLLSLQVKQGSCWAQRNSPSSGVPPLQGLQCQALSMGIYPWMWRVALPHPSLASTSVPVEEQTKWEELHVDSGRRPRWSSGIGFSMLHVASTLPCPKAQWDTIPTRVPLWFQSSKACSQQQWEAAKLVLGWGYRCNQWREYNKIDLKSRGRCFCLTSAQFLLTGNQAFVSHGRIILNC